MSTKKTPFSRRRFLATSALGVATIAMPSVLRAAGSAVKIGVLHPVTGALA
jgi:branched-chain amino acid transport system substrate-binding protein